MLTPVERTAVVAGAGCVIVGLAVIVGLVTSWAGTWLIWLCVAAIGFVEVESSYSRQQRIDRQARREKRWPGYVQESK